MIYLCGMMLEPSRNEIWKMFDQISATYDRVNRVMTYGVDRYWRKKIASFFSGREPVRLLDVATGTGDQIFSLIERGLPIKEAVGIDLAKEMLEIGKRKLAKKTYAQRVSLLEGSALELPFDEGAFDAVTISFGIRNVTDVEKCLKEVLRVLKTGGQVLILEGTIPENPYVRPLFLFYLRFILPFIGGLISKNKAAYIYLNQTMETFPSGDCFCQLMSRNGFEQVQAHPLTCGIVTIYRGVKLCL